MAEVKITMDNFENEVLGSKEPVLIDFWASWCGPCKMIAPVVAEVAEKYAGKLKVGKVNVDEEMGLAQRYRVVSIPTLVLIKDGEVVGKSVGYKSMEELEKWLADQEVA